MKKYYFLWLILLASTQFSCKDSPISSNQLVNKWQMGAILRNGQDVSEQHDPANNRWIELKADGTFVSDGEPHGRNTGKWIFSAKDQELYLDSDVGEGDDSYWTVNRSGKNLVLHGARSEFTRQFSMVWEEGL